MATPESTSTIPETPLNGTPGERDTNLGRPGSTTPNFQNDLCSRCSDIEGKLMQLVMPDPLFSNDFLYFTNKIGVGIMRNPETRCSLCRFFRGFCEDPTGPLKWYRRCGHGEYLVLKFSLVPLISSTKMFFARPHRTDAKDEVKYLALGLSEEEWSDTASTLFERGLLVPKMAGPSTQHTWPRPPIPFLQVSQVDPFAVSFSAILGWLQKCKSEHSACCRTTTFLSSDLPIKCIDCDSPTFRVVTVNRSVDYLALSYVWGSPQVLKEGGIPTVVQDAITVTKRLGKRYLWVDKYCVEQENHDLRAREIQAMDKVYEGAYATLCACAGSDATFGLPGVGGRGRNRQPQVAISPNVTLVSALPALHDVLRSSTWITRGWTYQEAVLSRRAIFFTDTQVYFACGGMRCSEALPIPELRHEPGLGRDPSQDASSPSLISDLLSPDSHSLVQFVEKQREEQNISPLRILMKHISRYTFRHLSYDEDILNAFRAILGRSPLSSFWGIPIAAPGETTDPTTVSPRDLELGFLTNLCWSPDKFGWGGHRPLLRRQGFPSWSWSGWKGQIWYVVNPFSERETWWIANPEKCRGISIYTESNTGDKVPMEQLHKQYGGQGFLPEITPYLRLQTLVIQVRFNKTGDLSSPNREMFLCHCHPTALHPPSDDRPLIWWPKPCFCDARGYSEHGLDKLWDCALLFVADTPAFKEGSIWWFLIIEWNDDRTTAFRVGTLSIKELPSSTMNPRIPLGFSFQRDLLKKVPHSWQSIRLG